MAEDSRETPKKSDAARDDSPRTVRPSPSPVLQAAGPNPEPADGDPQLPDGALELQMEAARLMGLID